jgi:hypothetical protein
MDSNLKLRQKWTFRAHGRQMIFIKKNMESPMHVWTKALTWALFLPEYPDLSVEPTMELRYKPDLVQLDARGHPVFWGEAGRISNRKIQWLVKRYRSTHIVLVKWHTRLTPLQNIIAKATAQISRTAPVDLIGLPLDSLESFIDTKGSIRIQFKDVNRMRM